MPDGGGFDLDALLAPFKAGGDLAGQTLSGCAVERLLGRGAMGEVWLARRERDGAAVVVKRLDPGLAADPGMRARLQREWSALALVGRHPNVVGVQAVALDATPPHLVLDHVPGEALDRVLARRRRLPAVEAAHVARDLALGLAAAHGQGLVHRDVKPANAILRPDGVAVLVDFGLARDVFASSLTQAGTLLGTAAYLAPEQWGDHPRGDAQSDLFALGATLYHLAAGEPPFGGADVTEIAERAQAGDYRPLAEACPDAPPELALVVDLLLEPEPRFRHARAADVADDLARALAGLPCAAPALVDAAGRRTPLVRARRWTLGTDPTCQVVLPAGASPRHAQLRREAEGFVLVDVKGSAGTWVEGPAGRTRVEAPRRLAHGERVVLGAVEVAFHEPLRAPAPGPAAPAPGAPRPAPAAPAGVAAALVADLRRVEVPEPVARALLAGATPDRRALAWLLELLDPDPDPVEEAGAAHALAPLGPEAARAAIARRRADLARVAAWAPGALRAAAGPGAPAPAATPQAEADAWRGWWAQTRSTHALQAAPARPPAAARLQVAEPGRPPRDVPLGAGVVLVGRDPRCHVVLAGPGAPRLAATLLRLHRRWLLRDEREARQAAAAPTRALAPAAEVEVAGARLRLLVAEAPWPVVELAGRAAQVIDGATFQALEALGHPAVVPALLALVDEARGGWPWLEAAAAGLEGAAALAAAARAQLVARAAAARSRLADLLGVPAAPGDPLASWRARVPAGPAVAPAGWLAATAHAGAGAP